MPSHFPSWIRKTMWRKFSAMEQLNAIQATKAFYGVGSQVDQSMAYARGLPENPIWIKQDVAHSPATDLDFLQKRVARRLRRDAKEQTHRDVVMKQQQLVCEHEWELIPGGDAQYCHKCKRTEFRNDAYLANRTQARIN